MTNSKDPRGQSGLTLMEILVTLVVIIVGLVGLMKVASVAVFANQKGLRLTMAGDKAQTRLEALKAVPTATLACLAGGSVPSACVSSCTAGGGDQRTCETALGVLQADPSGGIPYADNKDSTNTSYSYGYLVNLVGANVYDIQVVATFNDDTTDPPRPVRVVYRTAVYRGGP